MHVHQMGDELCIGCKARVIADVTAEGDCLQAKNTNDKREQIYELQVVATEKYLKILLGNLILLPCLDFTHTWCDPT